MNIRVAALLFIAVVLSTVSHASDQITVEPDKDTYHFVSQYSIEVAAPNEVVWKHLTNLGSWMYEFEMSHYSGKVGQVGEVFRLYPQQDFLVQITSLVPDKTLVIANLPSTIGGERSTGVGVITLNKIRGKTIVNLIMSRRYTWLGQGSNPLKATRESMAFQKNTRATWNKFLEKLRSLSESD